MKLLEPLVLAGRTAPNRVLFGPHETNLAQGRALSDRHRAYYEERAAGGAGVIVIEEASVHPSDWPYERSPSAADAVEGWTAIADACGSHGALTVAALGHSGGQGSSAYSQRELWAPSDEPEVNSREVPKIMEREDIDAVVAGFASAAGAARQAGLDGVEINAGQHSLVRQFLSGLTNRRDDDYGADRLRFGREVIAATRAALGSDLVLGLRLSCDELAPWAGITPEAAVDMARELTAEVDYVVVVRGSIFSVAETRPTGHHGTGFNLELTRAVRSGLGGALPVFGQGSIVDAEQAEAAIESGAADGIEMTRAQIAEPDLVNKIGADERPRPCLLCNQRCRVRDNRNPIVSCVVEPRAGFETVDPPTAGTDRQPLDVLVVGAGPAGLEAARVAARRGHRVRLVERAHRTGGLLPAVAAAPGADRYGLLADWLHDDAVISGVDIRCGTAATADMVDAWSGPVIVATGGRRADATFRCSPGADVLTPLEILDAGSADHDRLPEQILVWDPIGASTGVGIAEMLSRLGRSVTFVTPDPVAGTLLSLTGDLAGCNVRLQQAGVALERRQRLIEVVHGSVTTEHAFTAERKHLPADAVVDCSGRLPDDELAGAARRSVITIGDAVAARTVAEAIREGRAAALALGTGGADHATDVRGTPGVDHGRASGSGIAAGDGTRADHGLGAGR